MQAVPFDKVPRDLLVLICQGLEHNEIISLEITAKHFQRMVQPISPAVYRKQHKRQNETSTTDLLNPSVLNGGGCVVYTQALHTAITNALCKPETRLSAMEWILSRCAPQNWTSELTLTFTARSYPMQSLVLELVLPRLFPHMTSLFLTFVNTSFILQDNSWYSTRLHHLTLDFLSAENITIPKTFVALESIRLLGNRHEIFCCSLWNLNIHAPNVTVLEIDKIAIDVPSITFPARLTRLEITNSSHRIISETVVEYTPIAFPFLTDFSLDFTLLKHFATKGGLRYFGVMPNLKRLFLLDVFAFNEMSAIETVASLLLCTVMHPFLTDIYFNVLPPAMVIGQLKRDMAAFGGAKLYSNIKAPHPKLSNTAFYYLRLPESTAPEPHPFSETVAVTVV